MTSGSLRQPAVWLRSTRRTYDERHGGYAIPKGTGAVPFVTFHGEASQAALCRRAQHANPERRGPDILSPIGSPCS